MNADQLWETTMNPATRTLIRVRIDDAALAERRVTTLMGDKVAPRREWIEKHVKFTMADEGSILETKTDNHNGASVGVELINKQTKKSE